MTTTRTRYELAIPHVGRMLLFKFAKSDVSESPVNDCPLWTAIESFKNQGLLNRAEALAIIAGVREQVWGEAT